MRYLVSVILLTALTACAPEIPNSGASGVGFGDYNNFEQERAEREQLLSATGPNAGADAISSEQIAGGSDVPLTAIRPVNNNNAGISDEQDFGAVSSRESIESDRERLAAQRDAYEVIAPTALPKRSGGSSSSVVEFALSTTNGVGQQVYSRSSFGGENKFNRNCAKYPSSDQAQADFLSSGGPQRDGKGLDPDGDGFACYWDPAPFRLAVRN
ncbi:MAG: hypothetical protein ACU0CA_16760 [Paracoccaceae bacterium]